MRRLLKKPNQLLAAVARPVVARPAVALLVSLALLVTLTLAASPAAAFNPSRVSIEVEGLSPRGIRLAGPGDHIEAVLRLTAGSDRGLAAEKWLILTDPTGTSRYFNGTAWEASPEALGSGPLADAFIKTSSPPFNQTGEYLLQFMVDGLINGRPDEPALLDVLEIKVSGEPAGQSPDPPELKISSTPTGGLLIRLAPGGYTGQAAELWLIAQSPAGAEFYHDGRAWGSKPKPYSQAALAVREVALNQPGSMAPGQWIFSLVLDPKADGRLNPTVRSRTLVTAPGELPSLSVWTSTEATALGSTVELELDIWSGGYAGKNVELWLAAQAPDGQWWYYNAASAAWQAEPIAYAQTNLTDANPPAITSPPLAVYGGWVFWWGFDDDPNGRADGFNFYSRVELEVGG